MLALVCGTLLVGATLALAVVGIVALAGGIDPAYVEPRYPKPGGYRLHEWHIERPTSICVDPRGGPDVEWSLLAMVEDAVATWKAAAPSLPLAVAGVCRGAGGDADGDGQVRWERMDGLWGRARSPMMDVALNPDITPASWQCVRNVLLHEIGHTIGLDHQPAEVPSIMSPGGCQHQISLLDVAAVQYLYEGRLRDD